MQGIHLRTRFVHIISLPVLMLLATGLWGTPREWFSKIHHHDGGFRVRELWIEPDDDFLLAELSYNPFRKWTEMRYHGKLVRTENSMDLHPIYCQVFSAEHLGDRWVLTRAFDCDHIEIKAKILDPGTIRMDKDMNLEGPEDFFVSPSSDKKEASAIFVPSSRVDPLLWGVGMYKLPQRSKTTFHSGDGKKVKVLNWLPGRRWTENFLPEEGDFMVFRARRESIWE